jgi:cytochrome P450
MLRLFYTPQPIVEECGEDFFIPAHPKPREVPLGLLGMAIAARRSLIGDWMAHHYRACTDSLRMAGRQIVIVNEPDAIKHVMATHNDIYERKSPQMRRALEYLLGDGLFISDGETWKRRRPLVADIVHKNRLPVFAPTMEHVAGAFAERWATRRSDDSFDVLAEMAELTAEIIARTVFGSGLGAQAASEVISGFTEYQRHVDSFNLGYFLGADEGWPIRRSRGLSRGAARVQKVIDDVVERHLAGAGDESSMIQLLVKRREKSPELGLDVQALRNEAATIFMAGHETTASLLTWCWYCLAHARWAETALHRELDTVLEGRPPRVEDVPSLPYTRAVIEETLRLYPPVPILSRQASRADRLAHLDVEKGALVLVIPWLLHRAGDLWEKPNHFMPERFLNDVRPRPYSYVPFAIGPRICAGLAFGLTESILCLATLAQRFRVRVSTEAQVEPICRLTLRPKGGLPVRIEPR